MPSERRALGYQPALDGLRAIAIALVVCFHFFGLPGGYLGVDLFFVLSGFLITTLLLEERARHGSISFPRFYLRRALRLFPALWVFLAGSLVIYAALGSGLRGQLKAVLLGFTYTTNIGVASGHWDGRFGHLWSLAVEEQFYLVWPVVLVLALSRRASLQRLGIAAAATATGIMLLRLALMPGHVPLRIDAASVTRFDSVLLGCAVALVFASGAGLLLRRVAWSPPVAVVALGACAWLAATASGSRTVYHGLTYLFALAFAFVLVAVVKHESSPRWTAWLRAPLAVPPLVFLGRISYAVYLWHLEVKIWCDQKGLPARIGSAWTDVVEIAATLALATASYYLVERWFLRRKWKLARTVSHDADVTPTLARPRVEPEPSDVAVVRQ